MRRQFAIAGALSALLAVLLGAFGAHALREILTPNAQGLWHTASQYHFYHALGLLAVAALGGDAGRAPGDGWLRASGWSLVVGTLLFCGSLYLMALTGWRWLGPVTPLGGLAFIAGWLALALGVMKQTGPSR